MISMLVAMETEDGLRSGAIMVIAKKIGLAFADLLYHKTKNIILLLCTPTVLIYNRELGIINSSEFFQQKNSGRRVVYSLVCVVGGYHMKCLGLHVLYSLSVIILSETLKLPAALNYKIYMFYKGCTYQSTKVRKKCCEYFGGSMFLYIFIYSICWQNMPMLCMQHTNTKKHSGGL